MNLFLDGMPDHLKIGGQLYPIKTDFRIWMKFEKAVVNGADEERVKIILDILKGSFPSNMEECIKKMIWFYQCGDVSEGKGNVSSKSVYDFEIDQNVIYTSFIQYYKVDLSKDVLHWWAFRNMFVELPEESKMKKIMMYRSIKMSNVPKEQRPFYAEMKRLYALPDNRTTEQKQRSAASILAGGMNLKM